MVVDNDYYNRFPAAWRDESRPLSFLQGITPARFGYLRSVLIERFVMELSGKTVLDVGCGGGLLAEEFARAGCRVTGIDPSSPSLQVARAHATEAGLDIEYLEGRGEEMPIDGERFDVVYCCDVLEHVGDLDQVTAEIARALKPGGAYLYDTINRTILSKLLLIKLAQDWKLTRVVDFQLHAWNMFIKPEELHAALARHGLENQETVGFGPKGNPLKAIAAFWQLRRGRMSFAAVARSLEMGVTRNRNVSYMGYAVKRRGRVSPDHVSTIDP